MTKQAAHKALVVDDNPRWLKTLTRLVGHSGYTVSTARSYAEALHEVEEDRTPPDLIVTDIRLKDDDESNIDGLRLLQKLGERGQLRASIVVTGYPNAETRRIAEQLGAVYLEKVSFTREDFRRELEGARRKPSANSGPCLQSRRRLALVLT